MLHNIFYRFIYHLTWPLRALLYTPSRILAGSRRLARISLPTKMALLTFFFLVVCVVVSLTVFWLSLDDTAHFSAKVTFWSIFWITVLVILIPLVLHRALKLWLEGDISPYPDIDRAWRAGLAELESQELSLAQIPLFLVLGSAGESQEKSLFDAARLELNFRGVPEGHAPLHWYANEEGIYLVCTRVGSLSHLAELATKATGQQAAAVPLGDESARADPMRGTIVAGQGEGIAGALGGRDAGTKETPAAEIPAASPYARAGSLRDGTMMVRSSEDDSAETPLATGGPTVVHIPPGEFTEADRRIQHLFRLIRKSRQPLAPINGILTLLPFRLIERSSREAKEVQRAVCRDLGAVLEHLKIRCPVTALVIGMEEEAGFLELVRRVGRDRANLQRIGKGFTAENPPLPERLEALCAHACGAFEDWVYALFREKGALSKPSNTKLYSLLCKVRRDVKSRLESILVAGYSVEGEYDSPEKGLLFSGCYFGAIGETEDRQAFVHSVFEKLPEEQGTLEWTDNAVREDEQYQRLAHMGLAIDLGLLIFLAALVIYHWLGDYGG